MISLKKIYNNRFLILLIALSTLLCSGHTLQTTNMGVVYLPFLMALMFAIPIAFSITKQEINLHNISFLIFVLMVLCTMVVYLNEGPAYYISFLCIIMAAYGLSVVYSLNDMVEVFLKIMTVATIIALFGYYFINSTDLINMLPKVTNYNNVEYGTMYIYNVILAVPERNCGMFWEPGIFATYLTFSLVFEILLKKEKASIFRIIVFSWGMITTNSSAGFLLLVFALTLIVVRRTKKYNTLIEGFRFLCFSVFILLLLNYETILLVTGLAENEYVAKLLMENISQSSRALSVTHNLELFAENPIFGAGISTVALNMKYVADTSTSTYLMSIYGVLGVLYTVFWGYAIFASKKFNMYTKVLLLVIMIAIINKEPHTMIMFSWAFLFWLLKDIVEQKRIKN